MAMYLQPLNSDWQGNRRYAFNAKITMQDLRDYHMLPFQTCTRDVNAQSVMCSYNAVNGVPTCADPWLLTKLLRKHWSWEGQQQYVTSDCDSLDNVFADHRYKGMNAAQVAAECLKAGTDLDCGDFWPKNLGQAYNQKLFEIQVLDDSFIRRFAAMVRLGYFDPAAQQPYRQLRWKDVGIPEARSLALKAASSGIVVLKNKGGALPLPKAGGDIKRIAVVGPLQGATTQMQANYYGIAQGIVSPSSGFQKAGYTVTSVNGCDVACGNNGQFSAAVNAAKQADAVIYVGGIDVSIEAEDKDRNDITWPGRQLDLIRQLGEAAGSKPFIVVQLGSMVDSSAIVKDDNVDALVWAGYPGQDGGLAIANIVTGVTAPAARLPVTQYPGTYTRDVRMTDMNLQPGTGNPG
jgi:xylan 1,4-beta-xylosidase